MVRDEATRGGLASVLAWLVGVVVSVPRLTLLVSGILSVIGVLVTGALLEFQTSRSDLIDPDARFHRRWLEYVEAFPDTSDLVVVVSGRDRVAVEVTLERLGRRVSGHDDVLRSVLYRIPGGVGERPRYFTSTDGRMGFLRAVAVVPEDAGFEGAATAISRMRQVIREVEAEADRAGGHGGIEIGLTGIPVLESDEMVQSQQDMIRASLLAAVGVALLMGVGFGGVRLPLVILLGLGVSLACSFAATALTIGHLNILSMSFAVVLIGLGVDFSIHFLARYVQSRQGEAGLVEALKESAGEVGPGIVTAAVTTALAFGCASLTEFRGVAELGWIAGGGIVICAVVTLAVIPALVRLTDARLMPVEFAMGLMGERWRHRVAESPRVFLLVSLCVLGLAGSSLVDWRGGRLEWLVDYDDNLLNLQAEDIESVRVQRRVASDPDGGALFAVSLCDSLVEAEKLAVRMEALPSVGRVTHLGRFLPGADVQTLLKGLPAPLVSRYHGADGDWLVQVVPRESIWDREPLKRFVTQVRGVDPEATGTPVQNYEAGRQIKRSYEVAAVVAVGAIIVVLLVASLGLLRALAMLAVGGLVVGIAIETAWREQLGTHPALWATAFVATTSAAAMVLDPRAVRDTVLALLPPVAGGVVMLGAMQWLKIPLNPANLIVLPLVLGIGVDDGVHVLHDYRSRKGRYVMSPSTIHGVLLTSLTSMVGFGTLMIASHRGLSSLGLVLLLGVGSCLLVALVPLPAVLNLVSGSVGSTRGGESG